MVKENYAELSLSERRAITRAEVERVLTVAGIDRAKLSELLAIKEDTVRKFENGYSAASAHMLAMIDEVPARLGMGASIAEGRSAERRSPVLDQAELVLRSGTIEEARMLTQTVGFLHAAVKERAERAAMLAAEPAKRPGKRAKK